MERNDAINAMIFQHWLVVDEHVGKQLQIGFHRCLEPCFRALVTREATNRITREWSEKAFLAITKLLLVAIKKRYYAFPDKHVIAVDQEKLFDLLLPRAIDTGLIDTSIEPVVLLFNAGENLREVSTPFYMAMVPLLDAMARHPGDLRDAIHVIAWLAGDAKRRQHAIGILSGHKLPPEVLLVTLFKGSIPKESLLDQSITKPISDALASALAGDPWLSPGIVSTDPGFGKLVDVARSGKKAIPRDVEQALAARAASKSMHKPSSIKFLGKTGRYEGFGGMLDSPPIVIGSNSEASVIARSLGGRLFQFYYGGTGIMMHAIGEGNFAELTCTRDRGLVGRLENGIIMALQDGKVIGNIPRPARKLLVTGGRESAFFIDQAANMLHVANLSAGKLVTHDIRGNGTITSVSAIADGRLAAISIDNKQKTCTLCEIDAFGEVKRIDGLPEGSLVAACQQAIACLQPDGTLRVLDLESGSWASVPTTIDPATTTSFFVTKRELVTTHVFTYAIHFHGPPA